MTDRLAEELHAAANSLLQADAGIMPREDVPPRAIAQTCRDAAAHLQAQADTIARLEGALSEIEVGRKCQRRTDDEIWQSVHPVVRDALQRVPECNRAMSQSVLVESIRIEVNRHCVELTKVNEKLAQALLEVQRIARSEAFVSVFKIAALHGCGYRGDKFPDIAALLAATPEAT